MNKITARISDEHVAALKGLADATSCSFSEALRLALEARFPTPRGLGDMLLFRFLRPYGSTEVIEVRVPAQVVEKLKELIAEGRVIPAIRELRQWSYDCVGVESFGLHEAKGVVDILRGFTENLAS